jgi:hypothetical protein
MGSEALPQQVGDHNDNVATSIYTLSPLPPVLKHGLAAVSFFGFLSFLSTVSLLGYLSFKILKWTLRTSQPTTYCTSKVVTVQEHDLPDEHLCPQPAGPVPQLLPQTSMWKRLRDDPPNQFLVLILNLLFADVQQALAFLLNAAWLARGGVVVGNSMCWAQGWFVSTGDLASSVFISLIAVHTYLSVVHSYHMQTWAFYTMIASGWFFNYFMAILGVIITNNGAETGGLYVRAGAWVSSLITGTYSCDKPSNIHSAGSTGPTKTFASSSTTSGSSSPSASPPPSTSSSSSTSAGSPAPTPTTAASSALPT